MDLHGFFSSLNLHDEHVIEWLSQLDDDHPAKLRWQMRRVSLDKEAAHMSDCFENLVTEDERLERERYAAAPAEVEAAPGQQPVPLGADSQADAAKEGAGVRTLREEIMPYMKRVFMAGQYGTAKEFYKALMSSAGHVDSPFDRGEGANRGSLFVRALHKPLALKTVQNHYWPPT